MAEGWTHALQAEHWEPFSAGIEAHGLNPLAVKVMAEAGVDISRQQSQRVEELRDAEFDVVVTVCAHADENCPTLPGVTHTVHVPFDDPPKLAGAEKTDDAALVHYRRVRDEIRAFVAGLPDTLTQDHGDKI